MKKLILLFPLFFFLMTSAQEKKEINTDTKTENIEKQIFDLQKQIKVLEQQLNENKEVENTYKNDIEIIEKVEGFYDRSWEKLMIIISIAVALVGVVVPLFFNSQQNRNFDKLLEREGDIKKIQDELKKYSYDFQNKIEDFENQLENKIKGTEEKLKKDFEEETSKNMLRLDKKIYYETNQIKFISFLTQADINKDKGAFDRAINCFGASLKFCLGMNPENHNLKIDILFVIKQIENLITFISEESINVDFSSYKKHKEDNLNILKYLLTSDILPEENERIQKIINFIESH